MEDAWTASNVVGGAAATSGDKKASLETRARRHSQTNVSVGDVAMYFKTVTLNIRFRNQASNFPLCTMLLDLQKRHAPYSLFFVPLLDQNILILLSWDD